MPPLQDEFLSLGARVLPPARFTFESSRDRLTRWRVVTLAATERLSDIYECELDLATESSDADLGALLGADCLITIEREQHVRRLRGIVRRVAHLGEEVGHKLARVWVVPALWSLSRRVNSFIFQGQTVPEILAVVLEKALQPLDRGFRLDLVREYPVREYCVQYRETDLDFVQRLCEEEGIWFYFNHKGEGHEELVLVDSNVDTPCPTMDGAPVLLRGPEDDTARVESVRSFVLRDELQSTSVVLRDFDWTRPTWDLTRATRGHDSLGRDREVYEYPAELTLTGNGPSYQEDDGKIQARLRLQAHKGRELLGKGRGNVTTFMPGLSFDLVNPGVSEQRYLLTSVEHRGEAPDEIITGIELLGRNTSTPERYRNTFKCIPANVPYSPVRRHARTPIAGVQTAVVVGPADQEIHTDVHGRIKVQFHWDRAGKHDPYSSCWVRVAQNWAGTGWGTLFIPRIGMEVVVTFLEGNPDRPLVTGCVYNGANPPPYTLPGEMTRSGIKTSSSLNSAGFNELSFEDATGREEIYLHAERNLREVVKNVHSTNVGADQHNIVGANQSEEVGGDQFMSVTGNRTKRVDKDEKTIITGQRIEVVKGQETLTLNGGRDTIITTLERLLVDGRREETIAGGNDDLRVDGDKTDEVTGTYAMTGDQQVRLNQGDVSITLTRGGAVIEGTGQPVRLHNSSGVMTMDGGKIEVAAATELKLMCGASSITLKPDGTIELSGPMEVKMISGASQVKTAPAGVDTAGQTIRSIATGTNDIQGAEVKLNA
jgi:type VI secretion system secreted protein VgrG